jgi:catechol 2,3-dioxygenase-like lactoylglutathione lyase family enzyme
MAGDSSYRLHCSGVSELALGVADLERAESFYAGTLGLPVVERWTDAVWVMAGERTRIGLGCRPWRRWRASAAASTFILR